MQAGDFIGDTRRGGSCNAFSIAMNPHCHGTHTECMGHVVDKRLHAIDTIPNRLLNARLVSIKSMAASRCEERLPAAAENGDRVLSLEALQQSLPDGLSTAEALIIRTMPNPKSKRTQHYVDSNDYPYLTRDAMHWIVEANIEHLLIDTPSLDRLDDDGALELHRIFWKLPSQGGALKRGARREATVTEMIYVDKNVSDGEYLLALQPAPFSGDATPSNPTLFGKD